MDKLIAGGKNVLPISFTSENCILFVFLFLDQIFLFCGGVTEVSSCTSGLETRIRRCCAFNKTTDEGITYTKEVGEELQGLGRGVVHISPIIGRHAGRPVLWGPVVEEVGQQLSGQSGAVEALVENSSERRVRQQDLSQIRRRFFF